MDILRAGKLGFLLIKERVVVTKPFSEGKLSHKCKEWMSKVLLGLIFGNLNNNQIYPNVSFLSNKSF